MTSMNTSGPGVNDHSAMHALDASQREQAMSRIDELAMRAGRAERANKPTILLLLACLVLAGAFIFLMASVSRLSDARGELAMRRENAEQMSVLVAQLKQMRDFSTEAAPMVQDPDPQILSRISQVAANAGLANPLRVPTTPPKTVSRDGTVQRSKWLYKFTDPSLAAVMRFATLAEREIPGMRVHAIRLTPQNEVWSVELTLSRLERVE